MKNVSEENLTAMVLDKIKASTEREQEILTKLVLHLHDFIKDLEPTEEEWGKAIDFLTRTGKTCDLKRQEFILLSDVLGVSMLVDAINHRTTKEVTETTVTGPFHAAAIKMQMGDCIARGEEVERSIPTVVHGSILNEKGHPIDKATIDVWQSSDKGYYDVQDVAQPEMNLRGIFETDQTGKFWFRTIKPSSYPVPTDGPVGELLRASGRHPMRPAHIHFWIEAPGCRPLITHLFVKGDEYLSSDAVFGVKESLVLDFVLVEDPGKAAQWGVSSPFYEVSFDFKLARYE